MPVVKDVFISTGSAPSYIDVFRPVPGTVVVEITDALLTEDGQLLLTEDGLNYLALESASVS
jgi:hypothetical protein